MYEECQDLAVHWCVKYSQSSTYIYDLGCSTGTLILKIVKKQYASAKGVALASASINKEDLKSTTELNLVAQAWLGLTLEEQKEQIELVLDEHIRPALMNDGGNVQLLDVTDGEKVLVQYQGACGSCGSSLGATLSFMESTLRKHIYNEIHVVPQV